MVGGKIGTTAGVDAHMSTVTQAMDNDNDNDNDRFEISVDGTVAGFAQFVDREGRRIFVHTEVGEEYGGQGLGGALARGAVQQTIDAGLTVVPVCPFIKTWLERHPEHSEHVQLPTPEELRELADPA